MKRVMSVAENRGYIRTLMGRRRRFDRWEPRAFSKDKKTPCGYAQAIEQWVKFPFCNKSMRGIKRAYGYAALNALMQGSAADLMKKAMVDIWECGACDILGAPLLTVHDELNWSVPQTREAIRAHRETVHLMRTVTELKVPLLVSSDHGKNWSEAH